MGYHIQSHHFTVLFLISDDLKRQFQNKILHRIPVVVDLLLLMYKETKIISDQQSTNSLILMTVNFAGFKITCMLVSYNGVDNFYFDEHLTPLTFKRPNSHRLVFKE